MTLRSGCVPQPMKTPSGSPRAANQRSHDGSRRREVRELRVPRPAGDPVAAMRRALGTTRSPGGSDLPHGWPGVVTRILDPDATVGARLIAYAVYPPNAPDTRSHGRVKAIPFRK